MHDLHVVSGRANVQGVLALPDVSANTWDLDCADAIAPPFSWVDWWIVDPWQTIAAQVR